MTSLTESPPDDLVDFSIIREGWNDYDLEDGSLIRARVVLTLLLRDEGNGKLPGLRTETQIQVWAPPEKRAPEKGETGASLERLQDHVEQENVKFSVRSRGLSEYQTSFGVIGFRLITDRIHRTSLYNDDGDPMYILENGVEILHAPSPGPEEE